MSRFHNPYQFVPVNTNKTETFDWHKDSPVSRAENQFVRHDYWHEQGLSGYISATLTTQSPVVVGGKQTQGDRTKDAEGVVEPYRDVHSRLAIPGNSLRGMIGSVAEIVSCSAMRVLERPEKDLSTLRMLTQEAYQQIGVLTYEQKEGQKEGSWGLCRLIKVARNPDGSSDVLSGERTLTKDDCYQHYYSEWRSPRTPGQQEGVSFIRRRQYDTSDTEHELFIPWDGIIDKDSLLNVSGKVVSDLEAVLKEQYIELNKQQERGQTKDDDALMPYLLPKGYENHENRWKGEHEPAILPGDMVYFKCDKGDSTIVTDIGFSAISRRVARGSLAQAFKTAEGENALPFNQDRTELTPAECLFGVVEEHVATGKEARSLASRVRFFDAPGDEDIDNKLMGKKTLKILNSPKPPCPSMYFSSDSNQYVSKADFDLNRHKPNGRKRYLPHKPETPTKGEPYRFETRDENRYGDDKYRSWMHMECEPVNEGATFTMSIRFDNLKQAELDLLLFCLRPDDAFMHRLGLGKPIGLGHVQIGNIKTRLINRKARYTPESLESPQLAQKEYTFDRERVFDSLVNRDVFEKLFTLSNRENIKHEVCYPYSSGQGQKVYNESLSYQWFVDNDSAATSSTVHYPGQYLRKPGAFNEDGIPEDVPSLDSEIPSAKRGQR